MTVSTHDLYWLAGLMEGEGSFLTRRRGREIVVSVGSTDKDVIDRVDLMIKASRKVRLLPSGKTFHTWVLARQQDVAGLMMTLLPLMGHRRQRKIMDCLSAWKLVPTHRRNWSECSHGHPLSGENLRVLSEGKYTKRRCVECGKLRQRKYRASITWDAAGIFTL